MALSLPVTVQDINATWLADALTQQKRFGTVEIEGLTATAAQKWNVAETVFVEVRRIEAAIPLPKKLFVKFTPEPDPLASIFPGEQKFYAGLGENQLPVAPCLAAMRDETTGGTCLILEDLRPSHTDTPWPLPPTLPRCRLALQSLAAIHASKAQSANDALLRRETLLAEHVTTMLPAFLADLGDRLSPERADILSNACQHGLRLKEARFRTGKPVTTIHGDAHLWNALYPRDEEKGRALWIDWEDWRVDFAGLDLALMMAMHWYPERRIRFEKSLLEDYRIAFNEAGSNHLNWDDLWHDYRLGHVCNASIPIFQHAAGSDHASWWSHLERWFLAFDDLECRELLA